MKVTLKDIGPVFAMLLGGGVSVLFKDGNRLESFGFVMVLAALWLGLVITLVWIRDRKKKNINTGA